MSHYAQLDENNVVVFVITAKSDNKEDEFTADTGDVWKQTSYNTIGGVHVLGGTPFRKNYAGIDYTYDEERDAFIPPQPYESWVLNEETCLWNSPVPYPEDGERYTWDEETTSWIEVTE